jgi:hypothetical protein
MTSAAVGADPSWVLVARRVASYLRQRFPLHRHGFGLAVVSLTLYLLYDELAGIRSFGWRALSGAGGFTLSFLQLRLVDDLVDLESAGPAAGAMPSRQISARTGLSIGVVINGVALMLIQSAHMSLLQAAIVPAWALFTPFVLQRWVFRPLYPGALTSGAWPKDLVLGFSYEGVSCLIVFQTYQAWARASEHRLSGVLVGCVAGTFWLGFEFWKYSRFLVRPSWHPYGLGWRGLRRLMLAVLIAAACLPVLVLQQAGTARSCAPVYPLAVGLMFGIWLWKAAPRSASVQRGAAGSIGMLFVAALELGALLFVLGT